MNPDVLRTTNAPRHVISGGVKLLKCDMCGFVPEIVSQGGDGKKLWAVECACGRRTSWHLKKKPAANEWNLHCGVMSSNSEAIWKASLETQKGRGEAVLAEVNKNWGGGE